MKNIKEILDRPLPDEAIKPHPSRPYLSSINPIFVIDRFNEAFGIGGWTFSSEVMEMDKMVVVKVVFVAPQQGDGGSDIRLEGYGGNDNDDRGDAYKGAVTDALTKIGSFLGIGADVWRGRGAAGQRTPFRQQQVESKSESRTQEQSGNLGWLNLFHRGTTDVNAKGEEIREQLRSGQITVAELKEQYKINKQTFDWLVKWQGQGRNPTAHSDAQGSTQEFAQMDDDLPF